VTAEYVKQPVLAERWVKKRPLGSIKMCELVWAALWRGKDIEGDLY